MKKILIVDDEKMLRDLMFLILPSIGYTPITVVDYESALLCFEKEEAKETPFSAVILDINIPGEAIDIKSMPILIQNKNLGNLTYTFISSGDSSHPIIMEPEKYGFISSIIKPYSRVELKKVLDEYL
jgi:DNA-binding NtrC family response regulator